MGMAFLNPSRTSGGVKRSWKGVVMMPGATPFTRMFSETSSLAIARVRGVTRPSALVGGGGTCARGEAVYGDLLGAELFGHRLGEGAHASLGCGVGDGPRTSPV